MLLPNGKFLEFDGWQQPQPTYVFDPTANTYTEVDAPDSIFCAGNVLLPDGRVITIGGYGILKGGNLGIKDTAIFDPATSTWSRVADMHLRSLVPHADRTGRRPLRRHQRQLHRRATLGGHPGGLRPERPTPGPCCPGCRRPRCTRRSTRSRISRRTARSSPSARRRTSRSSSTSTTRPGQSVGTSGVVNGSSVMYRPGKILYSGGAPSVINTTNSTNTTAVIDLTAATPTGDHRADGK